LVFWAIFFVFKVDGMIYRCYKNVDEVFLGWNDLNTGLFGKNKSLAW
jgi:hypothetical protein